MKTHSSLEKAYFKWLCNLIDVKPKYKALLEHLHQTAFISTQPNDDNRVVDGEKLRLLFEEEEEVNVDVLISQKCSLLEMIIALLKRAIDDILGEGNISEWFWEVVRNVGYTQVKEIYWDSMSQNLIYRRYTEFGEGGLFPLKNPKRDQREVELWYQLAAYLEEHSERS